MFVEVPEVPCLWLFNTKKSILKQKLWYWHSEGQTLIVTHRQIGQIRIVYDQATWEHHRLDFAFNFTVYQIPNVDEGEDGSSSSGDDAMPGTSDPYDLPFRRIF